MKCEEKILCGREKEKKKEREKVRLVEWLGFRKKANPYRFEYLVVSVTVCDCSYSLLPCHPFKYPPPTSPFFLFFPYLTLLLLLFIIIILNSVIKLNMVEKKIIKYESEREIWFGVKKREGETKMKGFSSDSALPFFQDKLFLFSL